MAPRKGRHNPQRPSRSSFPIPPFRSPSIRFHPNPIPSTRLTIKGRNRNIERPSPPQQGRRQRRQQQQPRRPAHLLAQRPRLLRAAPEALQHGRRPSPAPSAILVQSPQGHRLALALARPPGPPRRAAGEDIAHAGAAGLRGPAGMEPPARGGRGGGGAEAQGAVQGQHDGSGRE